ncbi:MAG TPA: hypothetical protein PK619_02645 [bacterium]|nr:hypothetical protein [bacterium]
MIFLFLRLFPLLLPLIQLFILAALSYAVNYWLWLLLILLAANTFYFLLLYTRLRKKKVFIIWWHSLVMIVAGFVFILFVSDYLLVLLLAIIYGLIYFFYLESVFHYFYQTGKATLLSLENVINYVNLLTVFLGVTALINFYIFINFYWLWLLVIAFAAFLILFYSRFLFIELNSKEHLILSLICALLLLEFLGGIIFLPTSLYSLAAAVALGYYFISLVLLAQFNGELTRRTLIRYSVFTIVALSVVFFTALITY